MNQDHWNEGRGYMAAAIGCAVFLLVAAPGIIKNGLDDAMAFLIYLGFFAAFEIGVFWLFARPKK
jgi:hypothetical protein